MDVPNFSFKFFNSMCRIVGIIDFTKKLNLEKLTTRMEKK